MQPLPVPPASGCDTSVTAVCTGMSLGDLQRLLGSGQVLSQETTNFGQRSQEMIFQTRTLMVRATVVGGFVTRFSIESR
jgi:hypothetical protein